MILLLLTRKKMKFELSKKTQSLLDQVTEFINKEIIPNESLYEQQVEEGADGASRLSLKK